MRASENSSIDAVSVAASLAVGAGGSAGLAFSGAGAEATNVILTKTNAFFNLSNVNTIASTSAGDVILDAQNNASINATIVGAAVAVGGGGAGGIGVAIGAALARNLVGWDVDSNGDVYQDSDTTSNVLAYTKDTSINAKGDLIQTALADQTIDAVVVAASLAVAGGGGFGGAGSGAGVYAENRIATDVKAYIEGDGATGVSADTITIIAEDSSSITAVAGAVSIGVAFSGGGSVSASVGVAIAKNEVNNNVAAYVLDADTGVNATTGDIDISAHTLGRHLFDLNTAGLAFTVAELDDAATVDQNNTDTAGIDESAIDRTGDAAIVTKIRNVFDANGVKLSSQTGVIAQTAGSEWLVTDREDGQTYVLALDGGMLKVSASTISATTVAASVSVAIGTIGVSLSGAGATAQNVILSKTNAYVENSVLDSKGDISLDALSNSGIASVVVAASAAVAGGAGGVGASIGAAIAENAIGYTTGGAKQAAEVQAYLEDSSVDAEGDIVLAATSAQHVNAGTGSGSAAIAGGGVGVAASGSGASAKNSVATNVKAYIDGSGVNGVIADNINLSSLGRVDHQGHDCLGFACRRFRLIRRRHLGWRVAGAECDRQYGRSKDRRRRFRRVAHGRRH